MAIPTRNFFFPSPSSSYLPLVIQKHSTLNIRETLTLSNSICENLAVSNGANHSTEFIKQRSKSRVNRKFHSSNLFERGLPFHFMSYIFSVYFESNKNRMSESNTNQMSESNTNQMSESSTDQSISESKNIRKNRILSSPLFFQVDNDKVPIIYSSSYDISFLGLEKLHPFDSTKWGKIIKLLLKDLNISKNKIIEPKEASFDDLLIVHTKEYLNSLNQSIVVAQITELPPLALIPNCILKKKLLHPFRLQVGGTILGTQVAYDRGFCIHVGGGFHHCSSMHGGGFCAYADISLSVYFAFVRLNVKKIMIIDLDAHQGNGHERDFMDDDRVYIFDMFNGDIYPQDFSCEPAIRRSIKIKSGTGTDKYLNLLEENLKDLEKEFFPEFIIYNAGTDILNNDPLGRLNVSEEGIIKRDEFVFEFAKKINTPILMLTSGGYQRSNARIIANSIINLAQKNIISI